MIIICVRFFSPNAYQGADTLSSKGFQVFIPNFFKGNPLIPKDMANIPRLMKLLKERADWEAIIRPILNQVKDYLQTTEGIDKVGLVGFCWGAKVAMLATAQSSFYAASVLIHPSMLTADDFEKAQAPICLLLSKDEGEMKTEYEILKAKSFGDKCFYHFFSEMHHGFCAARGDWEVDAQRECASKALGYSAEFLDKNVVV